MKDWNESLKRFRSGEIGYLREPCDCGYLAISHFTTKHYEVWRHCNGVVHLRVLSQESYEFLRYMWDPLFVDSPGT